MAPKQRGVHVSLRNVTPTIPGNEFEHGMLKSDLADLGCTLDLGCALDREGTAWQTGPTST